MVRSARVGPSEYLRYLWERSASRTLRVQRRFHVESDTLERIRAWVCDAERPAISVCIPTKDRLDLLIPCLDSLAATSSGVSIELVIGDTGSGDELRKVCSGLGVRLHPIPGAFSFSRACNEMARVARGEGLLFLNSDTQAVTNGWADRLLESGENEIVGAALVYPGTRRLQHAGVEVVRSRRLLGRLDSYGPANSTQHRDDVLLRNVGIGKRLERFSDRAPVMAVTGAFLYTRRQQFDELHGFDEAFLTDLQDIDYCLRAREQGMQVICRRDIVFTHQHAASRGRYPFPIADWNLFCERWEQELGRWQEPRTAA